MPHPFRLRKHLFYPRIKQFFVGAKLQNGDNASPMQQRKRGQKPFRTRAKKSFSRGLCGLAKISCGVFSSAMP